MNLFDAKPTGGKDRGGRPFIADLRVNETVDTYFRVLEVNRKKKKDGGEFLSLTLMDRSGRMAGKIWDGVEKYSALLQPGQVVRIRGEVTEYNQRRELRITGLRRLSESDGDFVEADCSEIAGFDTAAVFADMIRFLEQRWREPHLRELLDRFAAAYGEAFQRHFGAQKIHHAYIGGLLEHTFAVVRLADSVADFYGLDKELLLAGALFHDIGKISEFNVSPAPETTVAGGLLGHIVIGQGMFRELIQGIKDFPERLSVKIQHLILSHHGEKEFGSPEVPRFAESYALHLIDMLDSRLRIFRELRETTPAGKSFSDFHPTLQTRAFVEKDSPE